MAMRLDDRVIVILGAGRLSESHPTEGGDASVRNAWILERGRVDGIVLSTCDPVRSGCVERGACEARA